jgi:hypothetical protein
VATLCVLGLAAPSYGASTRAEYVAQVDPVCQASHSRQKTLNQAYQRKTKALIARGAETDPPSRALLRLTLRFYDRIARIQRAANRDVSSVPPAPGDEQAVTQWVSLHGRSIELFNRAIHLFARTRDEHKFKQLIGRSQTAEMNAEFAVEGFHFQYCTPLLANP